MRRCGRRRGRGLGSVAARGGPGGHLDGRPRRRRGAAPPPPAPPPLPPRGGAGGSVGEIPAGGAVRAVGDRAGCCRCDRGWAAGRSAVRRGGAARVGRGAGGRVAGAPRRLPLAHDAARRRRGDRGDGAAALRAQSRRETIVPVAVVVFGLGFIGWRALFKKRSGGFGVKVR